MKRITILGLAVLLLCLSATAGYSTNAQGVITATPVAPVTGPESPQGSTDPNTCAQILTAEQTNLATRCNNFDKDQFCYGGGTLTPQFADPNTASQTPFVQAGDLLPIKSLAALTTSPLNPDQGTWGLAVIKAQIATNANVAVNQNVTFVIYGDTIMKDIAGNGAAVIPATSTPIPPPLPVCSGTVSKQTRVRSTPNTTGQILALLNNGEAVKVTQHSADNQWVFGTGQGKTGWIFAANLDLRCLMTDLPIFDPSKPLPGQGSTPTTILPSLRSLTVSSSTTPSSCSSLPPSGLFIEVPNKNRVGIRINGADLVIGSRILVTATPNNLMTITVLTGLVSFTSAGMTVQVPGGFISTVQLGGTDGLQATSAPSAPQPIPNMQTFAQTNLAAICSLAGATGLDPQCAIVMPNAAPTPTVPAPSKGNPAS